jgi:hypothetical protein
MKCTNIIAFFSLKSPFRPPKTQLYHPGNYLPSYQRTYGFEFRTEIMIKVLLMSTVACQEKALQSKEEADIKILIIFLEN